ncbi:MAG: Atg14 domain-containing protein, partial [Nitrospira sp.]|nr:Atg14 domain-containing protein [Nitrospira sp.]
ARWAKSLFFRSSTRISLKSERYEAMKLLVSVLVIAGLLFYFVTLLPDGLFAPTQPSEEALQTHRDRLKAEIERVRVEIEKARARQARAKSDAEKANLEVLITQLEGNKARIAYEQEIQLGALKFQQDLEFQRRMVPVNFAIGLTWRMAVIALIVTATMGTVEMMVQRRRAHKVKNERAKLVYPDEQGNYPVSVDQIQSGDPRIFQLLELKVGGEVMAKITEAQADKDSLKEGLDLGLQALSKAFDKEKAVEGKQALRLVSPIKVKNSGGRGFQVKE